ncbi:hypothetical protein A6R68_18119, partial [Neotoma lepida]
GNSDPISGALDVLQMKDDRHPGSLVARVHLGGTNLDFQIEWKRTWEKLSLVANAIAAIEAIRHLADASTISSSYHWFHSNGCCFTPGTFSKLIQTAFLELQLLVVTDSRTNHQLLTEVSTCLPSLCVTDSSPGYVDIAIPCNNSSSVGLISGTISCDHPWEVIPDPHRDPEEAEKEEQSTAEKAGQGGISGQIDHTSS